MGQRTATDTLFGIVSAFVEQRTWTQAALARRLETSSETIRRRLGELQDGGLKLERSDEPPHVYWSVPKDWFPGVLPFKADEVGDLLRLLGRAKPSQLRAKVLALVIARLANVGQPLGALDALAPRGGECAPVGADEEERWLAVVEDALAKKSALLLRYYTASRRHESWRHVSVHRIDDASRASFIATCHTANALRRFRISGVLDARLDATEKVRSVDAEALRLFDTESFGGFRQEGPAVLCQFVVRDPESAWVARNLPDDRMEQEAVPGGMRFRASTSAVLLLARFVAGLGEAARPETKELAEQVATLARGALVNATSG